LRDLFSRVRRKRTQNFRVSAFAARAKAFGSRACAEQKNFTQFASREGVETPESIKNERISDK